jgi:hypothetical protein
MSALRTVNHNLLSASAALGAVRLGALCQDVDKDSENRIGPGRERAG